LFCVLCCWCCCCCSPSPSPNFWCSACFLVSCLVFWCSVLLVFGSGVLPLCSRVVMSLIKPNLTHACVKPVEEASGIKVNTHAKYKHTHTHTHIGRSNNYKTHAHLVFCPLSLVLCIFE
jgi:hypothetical protein